MDRRSFLGLCSLLAYGSFVGLSRSSLASGASSQNAIDKVLTGRIVAASFQPQKFDNDPNAALAVLDLKTGRASADKFQMKYIHDALPVKNGFLAIPNRNNSIVRFIGNNGAQQNIKIPPSFSFLRSRLL